jgi:hypothetical protein
VFGSWFRRALDANSKFLLDGFFRFGPMSQTRQINRLIVHAVQQSLRISMPTIRSQALLGWSREESAREKEFQKAKSACAAAFQTGSVIVCGRKKEYELLNQSTHQYL